MSQPLGSSRCRRRQRVCEHRAHVVRLDAIPIPEEVVTIKWLLQPKALAIANWDHITGGYPGSSMMVCIHHAYSVVLCSH